MVTGKRVSIWVLGDQLLEQHPALAAVESDYPRENVRFVLVESRARSRRLPYQRKKLVLLLSAMRHYAAALREKGYLVDYRSAENMLSGLREHVGAWKPDLICTMAASDYQGRHFQNGLDAALNTPVAVLPNAQFLVSQFDPYPEFLEDKRYVLEYFYRSMRRHFNLLLDEDGSPAGGQWNFDRLNRQPLPQGIHPPGRVRFEPDEITDRVIQEVEKHSSGVGTALGFDLAVTHDQASVALEDFLNTRLESFGPYEDAMSSESLLLFHSLISPYLNIGLLEPLSVARMAESRYYEGQIPIQSVEAFIRQIIGWREFIYWQYWKRMPALRDANFWSAHNPLPPFFWNGDTHMNCLHHVIKRALEDGYNHHIERLMVVCNFCLLAGISPGEVNDWFTACYIDAYEWVMLPNVLGMGLFADGGQIATKPYIASANYINKMSDYCLSCRYQPKVRSGNNSCPFNFLYWNFLIQNEHVLRANPRMGPNVLSLRHIGSQERQVIQDQAEEFLASVISGAGTQSA